MKALEVAEVAVAAPSEAVMISGTCASCGELIRAMAKKAGGLTTWWHVSSCMDECGQPAL